MTNAQVAKLELGGAALEEQVLEDYASGMKTVREICFEELGGIGVGVRAFYSWLHLDPNRWAAWQEAKKYRAASTAEETQTIGDQASETRDGVQHADMRIRARQWLASKLDPEAFGTKANTIIAVGELHLSAVAEINAEDTARLQAQHRMLGDSPEATILPPPTADMDLQALLLPAQPRKAILTLPDGREVFMPTDLSDDLQALL